MPFEQVIGQQAVIHQLVEMVEHNRLSHALLFSGREGSGALALAVAFGQFLVCQPTPAPEVPDLFGGVSAISSGPSYLSPEEVIHTEVWHRASQYIHPDLHFSFPTVTLKSGDKPKSSMFMDKWRVFLKENMYGNVFDWLEEIEAGNKQGKITGEECDDLLHRMSLKSYESAYKVVVMWAPELLGKEGNKLLKLIEEPPPQTIFLLVTEDEQQVLPTILSRCQLVQVPPLDHASLAKALIEQHNIGEDQANRIAALASGNYREAKQLLKHTEDDWQGLLKDWLNATLKGGPVAQVDFIELALSKLGREKQKQFLKYFIHLIEQALRLRLLGENQVIMTESELVFASRLNKITGPSQQQALMQELNDAVYYVERNGNGKIIFQALTIKIFHIIQHRQQIAV
jgi:DNA polymerase-3 subunit delta'